MRSTADEVGVARGGWALAFRAPAWALAFWALGSWLGPASARALDLASWDRVLSAHVQRGGMSYGALLADPAAMAALDRFLASVARMEDDAPLSAWINAYNALVVSAVTARYPLRSVRDVPGFFDRDVFPVAGKMRTLDEIEREVIWARFHDARSHMALNCGAESCPPLQRRAFREADIDATLDRLARGVVARPAHVWVRRAEIRASQIFHWYAPDFRREAGSVLAWIRRYDMVGRTRHVPHGARVGVLRYDWRLNDRPAPRRLAAHR